jgi:hypothetical protein
MKVEDFIPAVVAGFAVTRLLELADPILMHLLPKLYGKHKQLATGLLSLFAAVPIVVIGGLNVLGTATAGTPKYVAALIVTSLVVSAGTDGANSILKFLTYKKAETDAKAGKAETTLEILRRKSSL